MNRIISKYGTFLIVPPLLLIIAWVALRFDVATKADVTLIQSAPGQVTAYLPKDLTVTDTLRIDSPDFGPILLEVTNVAQEPAAQRATCRGTLPGPNTLLRATTPTGSHPIYTLLLHR